MIYALYDENDIILGSYNRDELKLLLNTTTRSFDTIISRINRKMVKHIYYDNKKYKVYIYKEVMNNDIK